MNKCELIVTQLVVIELAPFVALLLLLIKEAVVLYIEPTLNCRCLTNEAIAVNHGDSLEGSVARDSPASLLVMLTPRTSLLLGLSVNLTDHQPQETLRQHFNHRK